MGSILYDFLSESVLFQEAGVSSHYEGLSEKEIERELLRYREHCIQNAAQLLDEVPSQRNEANLFFSELPSLEQLKRTALYVPVHIVSEPLLEHSKEHGHVLGSAVMRAAGFKEEPINRRALAADVVFMRAVRPMIAHNILKFVPSRTLAQPEPSTDILYSESLFAETLPPTALELMRTRAVVRSVIIADGVGYVRPTLEPCRSISVVFEGARPDQGYGYELQQQRVLRSDEKNRAVEVEFTLPTTPPPEADFQRWVEQSVNLSARNFVRRQVWNCSLAAACRANLCLDEQLAFDVLEALNPSTNDAQSDTMSSLLRLDLPIVDDASIETIVKVREEEGPAFQEFRKSLELTLGAQRKAESEREADRQDEDAIRQLFERDVAACRRKMKDLRRQGTLTGAIGAVSLLAAALQPSATPLLAVIAALQGFKTYDDYKTGGRALLGYFLWKMADTKE